MQTSDSLSDIFDTLHYLQTFFFPPKQYTNLYFSRHMRFTAVFNTIIEDHIGHAWSSGVIMQPVYDLASEAHLAMSEDFRDALCNTALHKEYLTPL